jgi:hypothetical protein
VFVVCSERQLRRSRSLRLPGALQTSSDDCLAGVALPLGLRGADSPRLHLVYTRVGWTLEHVCQQVEVVSDPSCEIPFTAVGCRPGVHHVTEILHTVGEVSRFRGDLRSGCLLVASSLRRTSSVVFCSAAGDMRCNSRSLDR